LEKQANDEVFNVLSLSNVCNNYITHFNLQLLEQCAMAVLMLFKII